MSVAFAATIGSLTRRHPASRYRRFRRRALRGPVARLAGAASRSCGKR